MPELPEVETTIRYLRNHWLNKAINDIVVTNGGERQINYQLSEVKEKLVGLKLSDLERHGKWMIFTFGNNVASQDVVGHLRMSGSYQVSDRLAKTNPHLRFGFKLENGTYINYLDQRRFGTWQLINGGHKKYLIDRNLGIDALSPNLSADYLTEKLAKTSRSIYYALLDQTVIAGLGNIYVNELLNITRIHPLTPSKNLPTIKVIELVNEIPALLNRAIDLKGTTLVDNLYNTPNGKTGEFARLLRVYGKHKTPNVQVIKIGGRSVFFTSEQTLY
jgi:formamidopyrimidine-DNA glycosylase